jgi:hypothetical protein
MDIGSLALDARRLNDRPPVLFLCVGFPEGIQRFRGSALARIDRKAKIDQPRTNRLICQSLRGFGMSRWQLGTKVTPVWRW